jgi:hypothetical protein
MSSALVNATSNINEMNQVKESRPAQRNVFPAVVLFLFGVYLLAGGYYGVTQAKWPVFLPPQFDAIGLLLDLFRARVAGYVGGGLLCLLGITCSVAGAVSLIRNDV